MVFLASVILAPATTYARPRVSFTIVSAQVVGEVIRVRLRLKNCDNRPISIYSVGVTTTDVFVKCFDGKGTMVKPRKPKMSWSINHIVAAFGFQKLRPGKTEDYVDHRPFRFKSPTTVRISAAYGDSFVNSAAKRGKWTGRSEIGRVKAKDVVFRFVHQRLVKK